MTSEEHFVRSVIVETAVMAFSLAIVSATLAFVMGQWLVGASASDRDDSAKLLLHTLARARGKPLTDAIVRENIDTIVIQGHTDERGSASPNWDLSATRANAVLDYMFQTNKTLPESYGSYFGASAYSKFRPLDPARTEAAYQQNRRIEISVIPGEANVRKIVDEYMRGLGPATPHHRMATRDRLGPTAPLTESGARTRRPSPRTRPRERGERRR